MTCSLCTAAYEPPANRPAWPTCMACTLSPAHARLARRGEAPGYTPAAATPDAVTFIVPGPPLSINRVYQMGANRRTGQRIMFYSAQGKRWKYSVAMHALQAIGRVRWDRTRAFAVEINSYFDNARSDADNPVKPILDALQGALWDNDRQVTSVTATKSVDTTAPRVVVTARAIRAEPTP